jgi:hypothetical protein
LTHDRFYCSFSFPHHYDYHLVLEYHSDRCQGQSLVSDA